TIGLGQAVGDWTLDNGEISRIIAVDLIVGGTTNGAITADGVLGAGNGVSHWQLLGQAATGTPQVVFQGQSSEFRGLLVNARGGIVASADVKTTTGDLEWTSTGALAGPNPIQLVGARAISAAGKLAISNSPTMSTTGDVILRAGTGVVLSGRVSAGGSFQIDADADRDGAGVFQLTSGGNSLVTNDHSLTVIASDIVLSSTINTGTASVTLLTDRGRSMGLGNAVADWSLSSAEYGLITTATLILGDAQSGDIRVDSLPNSTTKGAVQLRATGNGQHLEFTGGTNTFTSLTAHADAGIRIDSDLTTRNGNLILDGDANQAADGSLSGHDQIVIAAGVTLTARNGAIQLTAPTGGIVGAGVVSLLADRQIQLNSKMTASGNLSLTANDGIQIGADLTVDGSVTADADADTSGPGLLRVLAGAIMATTGGDVSVTSSDIDLQGKLSSGSGTRPWMGSRGRGGILTTGNCPDQPCSLIP
ncbi:MAG: hypothetical protein NT069_33485, partial [Planctomycetota bacterium]|nr:hypothetical protein [Planctomycetota bacterium]